MKRKVKATAHRPILHTAVTVNATLVDARVWMTDAQVWMSVVADPATAGVFLITCRRCGAVLPVACSVCGGDADVAGEIKCWRWPLSCRLLSEVDHHARNCCVWGATEPRLEVIPVDRVRDAAGVLVTNIFEAPRSLWTAATLQVIRGGEMERSCNSIS